MNNFFEASPHPFGASAFLGVYCFMNAQSQHVSGVGLPVESTRPKLNARKHLFDILAIVAVTGLALGVSDLFGTGSVSGLCLAIGAIFFGLAFIVKTLQKAEEAAGDQPSDASKIE
jgi:hypothetical protein